MLPARMTIQHQKLLGSARRSLSYAPPSRTLILGSARVVPPGHQRTRPSLVRHRDFSLATKRRWSLYYGDKALKGLEARERASKDKADKSIYPVSYWYTGHFINRYLPNRSWRLSSSWRKPGSSWGDEDKPPQDKGKGKKKDEYDNFAEYRKLREESLNRFEDFKKRIDLDPFGMFFGRRLERESLKNWGFASKGESRNLDNGPISKFKTGKGEAAGVANSSNIRKNEAEYERYHASAGGSKHGPSVSTSSVSASGSPITTTEEYEFDPITMRKVLKQNIYFSSTAASTEKPAEKSADIPVKIYDGQTPAYQNRGTPKVSSVHVSGPKASTDAIPIPPFKSSGGAEKWLVQEGFGVKAQTPGADKPRLHVEQQTKDVKARIAPCKIESALDRHLREASGREGSVHRPKLEYEPKENKTEDVDLLRASDVRASSGHSRKLPKETADEQEIRRKKLAADYDKLVQSLESQFAKEIAPQRTQGTEQNAKTASGGIVTSCSANANEHECSTDPIQPGEGDMASNVHEFARRDRWYKQPVFHQAFSLEPGEGDMASNVHEFANRDRWYKRKAPHAMNQSEIRFVQAAKDRALIREVRSIYEDTYGIIDTKHRQPSQQEGKLNDADAQATPEATTSAKKALAADCVVEPHEQSLADNHLSSLDLHELSSVLHEHQPQRTYGPPNLEGLAMIQRLFEELHQTQNLIQAHHVQLSEITTIGQSRSLLQSLKEAEQRVLQTLKTAWNLLKTEEVPPHESVERDASKGILAKKSKPPPYGPSQLSSVFQQPLADTYKVLAYDSSTQKVTTTKTASLEGLRTEKPLPLSEALSGLVNPARFLPHLTSLHNAGYEIISGGTNSLVFKKIRQAKPSAAENSVLADFARHRDTNPIDGTTTQTGNFASPTGFVNHDSVLPAGPSELPSQTPPYEGQVGSGEKVRREEDVFSGSSRNRWQEYEHHNSNSQPRNKGRLRRSARRKRTFKRMAWVGAWTAGCCYAVGIVTEYLRA